MEKKKKVKYYFVVAVIAWCVILMSVLFLNIIPVMFLCAVVVITVMAFIIEHLTRERDDLLQELLEIKKWWLGIKEGLLVLPVECLGQ